MKAIKVTVTQAHINNGASCSSASCPVALALRDLGPQYSYLVNPLALYNIHNEKVAALPAKAIGFIHAFDSGRPVEPFSFYVQIDK